MRISAIDYSGTTVLDADEDGVGELTELAATCGIQQLGADQAGLALANQGEDR